MNKTPWFESWFDTPFYHILYKNRDYSEAEIFIKNLLDYLNPPKNSNVLDLACGKGRHAIFLAKNELNVTGVDLSTQSIEHAKKFEQSNLNFDTHDMREVYKTNHFDYILNLFTSFGYFDNEADNFKAIKAMSEGLKPDGTLVIDFMNSFKVAYNLREKETIVRDDILFKISRKLDSKTFVKSIEFVHEKKKFAFEERVQALTQKDFEKYFKEANLKIVEVFGNYNLDYFSKNSSDRLILVAKKIS